MDRPDLDDPMERYRRVLVLGPWEVYHVEPPENRNVTYRGEPAESVFKTGYASLGDPGIEFIEPIGGPSVHRDLLEELGEGIHHLACFEFEGIPAVKDAFEGADVPIVQRGQWHDRDYIYFYTTDLLDGLYFETLVGGEEELEPSYAYPEPADE